MKSGKDNSITFDKVYETVFPIIYRVALRVTGDGDISEELCQEAFIKYYERMDSLPNVEQAKFWLIRVIKNLSFNYEKRKGRERRAYDRVLKEPKREPETGEITLMKKESLHAVQDALDMLPYNLRIVLVLKEYARMNYREIGSVLGISEGNVKVRVFRARERLAELFKEGELYVP
jgi:RNA polymerase sigma-70 factor (ECF subfamily)